MKQGEPHVICLESDAFYALLDEVLERVNERHGLAGQNRWVTSDDAMRLLNISSRTTLQKLRDEGKLRFSQPERKNILYDRDSITAYIERHVKDMF